LRCLLCNCDVRNYVQKVWRWVRQKIVTFQLKRFPQMTLLTISALNDRILKRELGEGRKYVRVNNPLGLSSDATNSIEGKSDFFYVGRASPEKGLDLFAQAVAECGVHGVVVGDGASLAGIRERFPSLECLGWVASQNVRDIIRSRAAALVFPSRWYETAGLTPLEAMAEGVPCIISDVTASSEYVKDGLTGLLFKSGDIADLKDKLSTLSNPLVRLKMSDNIRSYFNIEEWDEYVYIEKLNAVL